MLKKDYKEDGELRRCRKCGTSKVVKNGRGKYGKRQHYKCKICKYQFSEMVSCFSNLGSDEIIVKSITRLSDEFGIDWNSYKNSINKSIVGDVSYNGQVSIRAGGNLFDTSDNLIIFVKEKKIKVFLYIDKIKFNNIKNSLWK